MKDADRAPNLALAPGLNNVDYKQKFVQAPMSAYPKKHNSSQVKFDGSQAMKITMGK